ncbi:hypothetical protein BS47DRAFT_1385755 [Hydnum rufescens UP504]|uniref:F-box domain-containing protein n=1 Tax=Hydnum rufescens UP504 TaxID=1448309 RepID=A0A9P6DP60_9AGAM|nr:hypothetical protein BS47DRAFT_1385755 [Hydnum rufescens UP504]
MDVSRLPIEILLKVFKYLDGRDLVRCLKVCNTWKHCIDESSAARYPIRLAKHGYKDGPHTQNGPYSSTSSRLKALEDHINRWKSLDWIEERIRLPDGDGFGWWGELVGEILAFSNPTTIALIELPSRIRQTPLRTWVHENDFEIFSSAIDPTQDLLALVEANSPHPRASDIIRLMCMPRNLDNDHYHFGAMGDTIALLDSDLGQLVIWNWWTGELICTKPLQADVTGFLLIGPRTILLPWSSEKEPVCKALALYEIAQNKYLHMIVALELPRCIVLTGMEHSLQMEFFLSHSGRLNQMPSGPVPFDSSEGSRHVWIDDSKNLAVLDFTPNLAAASPDSSKSQSSTLASRRKTNCKDHPEPHADNYESPFHAKGTSLPYHGVKRKVGPPIAQATTMFIDNEHIVLSSRDDDGPVLIILTL